MNANRTIFGSVGRRQVGLSLSLAAALVALHAALPAGAQQPGPLPLIQHSQTVQGNLGDANDTVLPDGRPVDQYRVAAPAGLPVRSYAVRAVSPQIPLASTVSYLDPAQQQFVALQRANTFAGGQGLLYGGILPQASQLIVDVYASDPQQPLGAYTLRFGCLGDDDDGFDDDGDDPDDCFDDRDEDDDFDDDDDDD